MMTGNQQPIIQPGERNQSTSTEPSYVRSANVSTASKTVEPTIRESQPEVKLVEKNNNPALTRALVGGLIGATLGTLAGALAGKRTSVGFNHAVKGVGNAFKTVGSGLSQAGKGLGDATRSVGEGVSYAVVGGTVDAAKSIADGAMQAGVATADAVQTTVGKVNEVVQDTADSVKAASELTTQSIASTAETGREISSNVDIALKQDLNQAEIEAAQISDQENPFPSLRENRSKNNQEMIDGN